MNDAGSASATTRRGALVLSGIRRGFGAGHTRIEVLLGVDLDIAAGEIVALVGPSGAGKSTLLHIAGLLERPDSGEIAIAGEPCAALGDARRTALRRSRLGFVYQFHHLLPEFSALENVAMPLLVRRTAVEEAKGKAREILDRVGLGQRLDHRPYQLSGGERQRAAVARALVTQPKIILADEPTGNLDGANAESVFELMLELNRERGTSLVIVTHDLRLANRMERVLEIHDGTLTERPAGSQ